MDAVQLTSEAATCKAQIGIWKVTWHRIFRNSALACGLNLIGAEKGPVVKLVIRKNYLLWTESFVVWGRILHRISTPKNLTSQRMFLYITESNTKWFRCAKSTHVDRKNATHSPTHPCIWDCYLLQSTQNYSGAHPGSMSIDTGAFSPGLKAAETWYSSFTSYWYQYYEPDDINLWLVSTFSWYDAKVQGKYRIPLVLSTG
jgi:hypothetical protein